MLIFEGKLEVSELTFLQTVLMGIIPYNPDILELLSTI